MSQIQIYELDFENKFRLLHVEGENSTHDILPHHTHEPHRHNFYEIRIFEEGAGIHEIDFQKFDIQSNSIHFLSPGQVHAISRGKGYQGFLFLFSREFYSLNLHQDILFELPFLHNYFPKPILNLNKSEFSVFLDIIRLIREEAQSSSQNTKEIIRGYLHIFFLKCKDLYYIYYPEFHIQNNPSPHDLIWQFKSLLEQQFKHNHSVTEYADQLTRSPVYLSKIVKKITGKTASDLILNRIMLEAKRLLLFTDMNTKEVAYELHYDDPSYFSRIFRKKVCMNPSDFKKTMKQRYFGE